MAFGQGAEHYIGVTATTAGAASTFNIAARSYIVINDGPNTVYWSHVSTAGTTAGLPIKSAESISIAVPTGHFSGVSYITSTSTGAGPTGVLRIFASR